MTLILAAALLAVTTAVSEIPIARIIDDAKAVDRVAAASKRDLPRDLLRRIVEEDLDLLRGRHADATYDYASYERMESGRVTESFSVQPRNDEEEQRLEIRGPWVYKLMIELPSRRMLLTKNKKLYLDRVDIEYVPEKSGTTKSQSVKVDAWLEPGATKNIDLPEIARQATVRVYARAEKDSGYGNITLSLAQARVFDNPDSPYADAVASGKAILRALDHGDVPSMRAMAQRMVNDLQGKIATAPGTGEPPASIQVVASRTENNEEMNNQLNKELQAIEDLLTGNENERREGLDRLHQLIRKLRSTPR